MLIDISGYEGIYQINPQGEIYSCYRKTPLKGWIEKTGYRAVSLWKEGKATRATVHTLLAKQFIPNPNNLPEVNHIDGTKLNNSLNNLEWVSGVQNIRHAFTEGLTVNSACVDYAKIPQLLEEVISGVTLRELADREGIKESSTLRKLLLREAQRLGKEEEFVAGTKKARESIVGSRSHTILQLSPQKTLVNEFASINAAARYLDVNPTSIFKAIKKQKEYKGFYWEKKNA